MAAEGRRCAQHPRVDGRTALFVRRESAEPRPAPVDYAAVLAEHGMHCHICDAPITSPGDLHFDHVIPLSKGGPHARENLRPAHARCNLRKGARVPA